MPHIPISMLEEAKTLQNILISACEGRTDHDGLYQQIRSEWMNEPALRPLLPEFVRTCRDLSHFWGYIKSVSPKWEPRRHHVRDSMTPLFDHLEGASQVPVDKIASDVLQKFDVDGVHIIWEKALGRSH